MYAVSKHDGFSDDTILAISGDTSFPGQGNFIPRSGFWTEAEMRQLFCGLEGFQLFWQDLKYFPLPFHRSWGELRWGFS